MWLYVSVISRRDVLVRYAIELRIGLVTDLHTEEGEEMNSSI